MVVHAFNQSIWEAENNGQICPLGRPVWCTNKIPGKGYIVRSCLQRKKHKTQTNQTHQKRKTKKTSQRGKNYILNLQTIISSIS